jgi:hypothetical protein
VVETDEGRILFDASTDVPPARDVPAEAHRRFRADLRGRREQNLKTRAEQLGLHEEKKCFAADWIATHGTAEQQDRQAAGVLSIEEVLEAITDHTFAAVAERPRYVPDATVRIEEVVRSRKAHQETIVLPTDISVRSADAETLSASQWALVNEFQAAMPDAKIVLRVHKISWKSDPSLTLTPSFGILATQRFGPFTLRREFAACS